LARFVVGLGAAAIGGWMLEPPGQYALVVLGLLLATSGVMDWTRRTRGKR
jgi:hypothetical protein